MSEDIKSHLLVEKKGRIAYVTLNPARGPECTD